MAILGLDTATRATAVALTGRSADDGAREFERRDDPPADARPGHTSRLLALTVEALGAAGCTWAGVERIAVGVGPGTFTGLRIGIATARALSQARGIPLVGVSTLQSLALCATPAARKDGVRLVCGVIDARRGELFAAAWGLDDVSDPAAQPVLEARPYAPDALAAALRALGEPALAVGDGALGFREFLEGCAARVPAEDSALHRVSAIGHCHLGAAVRAAGRPADPSRPAGDVLPPYLRLPDAELSRAAK